MRSLIKGVFVCTALLTVGATAQQTTVTTPGGNNGTVPLFTSKSKIANSVITQHNGEQVGINFVNDSPYDPLFVQSIPAIFDGGGVGVSGVVIPDEGDYAFAESNYWLLNPAAPSEFAFLFTFGGEGQYSNSGELTNVDAYIYDPRSGTYTFAADGSDNVYIGGTGYRTAPSTIALFAGANGNVGLGTNTPGARLEVNGDILLTHGTKGAITFPDGTVQTTAFTGAAPALRGGDFAESINVSGERAKYEPGDVLVIDSSSPGKFLKSGVPYSTSVSGIYSTKPGNVGRRQMTPQSADELPMAMMGIVPTHVTDENGPIHPGDLLVTSSTLGYAMRGTDRSKMLGAVIGKALGGLDSGKGVIEVVVTLQ